MTYINSIPKSDLKCLLIDHLIWLNDPDKGARFDLLKADLYTLNLSWQDLRHANFYKASLVNADFHGAKLNSACFSDSDLRGANFRGADLRYALFYNADLRGADLSGANLLHAELPGVKLDGAKLAGTCLKSVCPESGEFIGWKLLRGNDLCKLLIPADARRCSGTSRQCRCDKAKVLAIWDFDGHPVGYGYSWYDSFFKYVESQMVEAPDYDPNRWVSCSKGIHFFMSRKEARDFIY